MAHGDPTDGAWEPPATPRRLRQLTATVAAALAAGVLLGTANWPGPDVGRLAVDGAPESGVERRDPQSRSWRLPAVGLWGELPTAPLQPRIAQSMLWTGRGLFVWGGFASDGRPLHDGAVFDTGTGTWRPLAPTALRPTIQPAVMVAGRVLVVSATAAAAYDVERGRWTDLSPPPLPRTHVLTDRVVGGPGAAVAVAIDRETLRLRLLAVGPDGGWRTLPAPPAGYALGDLLLGSSRRLTLLGRPGPGRATTMHHLDRDADRWQRVPAPPGLDRARPVRLEGSARAGRLVVLGVPEPGDAPYVARYARRRGWEQLPSPHMDTGDEIDVIETGADIVLWDRRDGGGLRYDDDLRRWVDVPRPPTARAAAHPAVWTGEGIVSWGGLTSSGAVYRLP